MALNQSSAENLDNQTDNGFEIETSDADDMSIIDPPERGLKGGYAQKDAVDENDEPWSIVDYLWKHHGD